MREKQDYTIMDDKTLVQTVMARFGLKQVELARVVFVTQSRVSQIATGKGKLRPAVRQQLVSMLEVDDTRG